MSLKKQKKHAYNACVTYANERIQNAKDAIEEAQASANSETKSTAGDKHDTSRAMMQIAVEQNTAALNEALKLAKILNGIDPEKELSSVGAGSLVKTNRGNYYISVSAGKITVENEVIFCLSPSAPIGQAMLSKKAGDSFQFNQLNFDILEVI